MLRLMLFAFTALILSAASVLAQKSGTTEGGKTAKLTFSSIDIHNNGYFHLGDLELFVESVFRGMDYDDDGKITYGEFAAWDPGFLQVAGSEGRPEAYATATKILFSLWDLNGNGTINRNEMRRATTYDFTRADLDNNGVLTPTEFKNFSAILIFRAAIRPDL